MIFISGYWNNDTVRGSAHLGRKRERERREEGRGERVMISLIE